MVLPSSRKRQPKVIFKLDVTVLKSTPVCLFIIKEGFIRNCVLDPVCYDRQRFWSAESGSGSKKVKKTLKN
jgi:hypothetical protein